MNKISAGLLALVMGLLLGGCGWSNEAPLQENEIYADIPLTVEDFTLKFNTELKETEIRINATTLISEDTYDAFQVKRYQPLIKEPLFLSLLCDGDSFVAISICYIFDYSVSEDNMSTSIDYLNSLCTTSIVTANSTVSGSEIDSLLDNMNDEAMLRADCTYSMAIGNTVCNINLGKEDSMSFSVWSSAYTNAFNTDFQDATTTLCYTEYWGIDAQVRETDIHASPEAVFLAFTEAMISGDEDIYLTTLPPDIVQAFGEPIFTQIFTENRERQMIQINGGLISLSDPIAQQLYPVSCDVQILNVVDAADYCSFAEMDYTEADLIYEVECSMLFEGIESSADVPPELKRWGYCVRIADKWYCIFD